MSSFCGCPYRVVHMLLLLTQNENKVTMIFQFSPVVVQQGRERDAVTFFELYRRLCSQQLLKSRSSLLYFLLTLASDRSMSYNLPPQVGGDLFWLVGTFLSTLRLEIMGNGEQGMENGLIRVLSVSYRGWGTLGCPILSSSFTMRPSILDSAIRLSPLPSGVESPPLRSSKCIFCLHIKKNHGISSIKPKINASFVVCKDDTRCDS